MIFQIYKISNFIDNKLYVGCTRQNLSTRFSNHKCYAKMCLPYKLYQHMNELGVHRFLIRPLETIEVEGQVDMKVIRKAEQKWIDKLLPELNMNKAYVEKKRLATIAT